MPEGVRELRRVSWGLLYAVGVLDLKVVRVVVKGLVTSVRQDDKHADELVGWLKARKAWVIQS